MIRSYLPALVFIGLGTILGLTFTLLNSVVGPRGKPRQATVDPYECGLPSEVKRNFPVAIQLKAFGTFALLETIVFIALLGIAFIYVWRRGALEWR